MLVQSGSQSSINAAISEVCIAFTAFIETGPNWKGTAITPKKKS